MSKTTRATQALEKHGIRFTLHAYDYDPDAESIGLQAAEALGVEPHRMLKTLMAEVDGKPVCAVVPSDAEVSMKKLASAFGGKAAKMMRPADAERLTGYHVGGISPFGQKKARAGGDRGGSAGPRRRIPQRRPARIAGRARSPGRREGSGRDRTAADGVRPAEPRAKENVLPPTLRPQARKRKRERGADAAGLWTSYAIPPPPAGRDDHLKPGSAPTAWPRRWPRAISGAARRRIR